MGDVANDFLIRDPAVDCGPGLPTLKVLSLIGTRPEAIKMAPVIRELERYPGRIKSLVCTTGQHDSMLHQAMDLFGLIPDIELPVIPPGKNLSQLTISLMDGIDRVIGAEMPDWVLAQGDTTTVLVAGLVAFYHRIPFGHVEAGLRSGNLQRPFPEEANRRIADQLATLLFAPTRRAEQRLIEAGHPRERIVFTGNTVIDALNIAARMPCSWTQAPLASIPQDKRLVLVTAHRRESFGQPLRRIFEAIRELASLTSGMGVHFVFPVHLNPAVRQTARHMLAQTHNITLLEPLDYLCTINLLGRSELVITDSGGLQEEAPALGVPVLVLRDETERPEGVEAGVSRLVGTECGPIIAAAYELLTRPNAVAETVRRSSLYGDGRAAERIVTALLDAHDTVSDQLSGSAHPAPGSAAEAAHDERI